MLHELVSFEKGLLFQSSSHSYPVSSLPNFSLFSSFYTFHFLLLLLSRSPFTYIPTLPLSQGGHERRPAFAQGAAGNESRGISAIFHITWSCQGSPVAADAAHARNEYLNGIFGSPQWRNLSPFYLL